MLEHGRLAAPLLLPLALVHGQEAAWGQCAPEVLPALLNLCGGSSRKRNELGLRRVYVSAERLGGEHAPQWLHPPQ